MTDASRRERYVLVANGEQIGNLTAVRLGDDVEIDYAVDNNGRGPKLHEHIRLDAHGIPVEWRIDGTSLMGAAVHEVLTCQDDRVAWRSQADEGHASRGDTAQVYIANDTSPYAYGIYARAALAAGGWLDALPAGRVSVRLLRQVDVDSARLDVYALTGVGLLPEFVLLDRDRQLVAHLGGDVTVRRVLLSEDMSDWHGTLAALDSALGVEYAVWIQQRVRHRYEVPVRIRNVRVFDPSSLRLSDPVCVSVFRDRITTVESEPASAPAEDVVQVDGLGGTLLAGLHDMHAHNSGWTGPFYLAAGVTTVRDMGNDNEVLLGLLPKLRTGELPGPTIVLSGLIEGRSSCSARLGVIVDSLEEGLRAVRWYANRGYHQIKFYSSLNPNWVKPLAAEAHRLGLPVVGHVPAFTTADDVIEDGYDEITHINQLMLGWLLEPSDDTRTPLRLTAMARAKDLDLNDPRVRHTVELMRRRGVGLDTTAVILERLMLSRSGQVQDGDAPYLEHMPIGYRRYRKRTFVPVGDERELRDYEPSYRKLLDTMALLHRSGIKLWPGTDDGTGFTVHRELELYVAAGIPAAEVLRIATFDCAAHLGRAHATGSVERGKHADLILVDGDPTQDISAVRRVLMVMKRGDVYFPAEIYRELDIKPFAPPPPINHSTTLLTNC